MIVLESPRPGASPDDESYYHVKNPDGKVVRHTRASNFTDLLDDSWALRRYDDRMLAHGLAKRKDLVALAAAHNPNDDKRVYHDTIIPQARAAAEMDAKANIGTALHRNTEEVDRGTPLVALDPEWRTHLQAYAAKMAAIPFEVVEQHIERVVILDGYKIAGTLDRVLAATRDTVVRFPNGRRIEIGAGELIIGDLKTGRWGLDYNQIKWPMQCAIYAHHTATWHPDPTRPDEPEHGERGPVLGTRPDVAMVVHLQAEDPTAPCHIHWLDLEAGYDMFLTAVEIRGHRSAAKKAHCAYVEAEPTVIDIQMAAWARARLDQVGADPQAKADLLRRWPLRNPDDSLIRYGDQPTPEQTAALLAVLDDVEALHQLPFCPQPGSGQPQPQTRK